MSEFLGDMVVLFVLVIAFFGMMFMIVLDVTDSIIRTREINRKIAEYNKKNDKPAE